MADLADIANEQTEFFLGLSLRRLAPKSAKPSAQYCDECGDAIPLARQVASPGCDACIDCQEWRERRK